MKKLLFSVIIILTLSTVSVMADEALKKKEAVERPDFYLVVDGEVKALDNPVYTIDGVTYVAVREVSTLTGSDVHYDKGVINIVSTQEEVKVVEEVIKPTKRILTREEIQSLIEGQVVAPQVTKEEQIADLQFKLSNAEETVAYYERRKKELIEAGELSLIDDLDHNIQLYTKEKEEIQKQLDQLK